MAAPASQPTQPPHKATWVVEAWRQRGLISDDVVSTEQLTELHANSWFARRNRRSPHTAHPPPVDGSGWLARRNRKQQRAAPGVRRQASRGLEVWVKAKLPQGVQPMRARAATSPALMRPEGAAVKPVNESLGSSTESLPGSGRDRSPSSLAMPGVPLGRLEPLERDDGPRPQVELTLYDLCTCCNQAAHLIGVGVYHTGIVVEVSAPVRRSAARAMDLVRRSARRPPAVRRAAVRLLLATPACSAGRGRLAPRTAPARRTRSADGGCAASTAACAASTAACAHLCSAGPRVHVRQRSADEQFGAGRHGRGGACAVL
jgi:hypothetical protein